MNVTTTRPQRNALRFIAAYGLCLVVQVLGGYFTQLSVNDWYQALNKSPLTPAGMWFGVAWTILYFLMALAAARIAKITGQWNNRPLRWWLVQLFVGLVWTMVFFGHRDIENGFYVIAFNWVAVLVTIVLFSRVNRVASALMLPLWAWLTFATYLNLYILQHN